MPKLLIEGKLIIIRWLPEWDQQILFIGKTFKKKGDFVDWQTALEEGHLKGLPALKLHDYSHRLTELKKRKKDIEAYREQRREYHRNHPLRKISNHGSKIREELYRNSPAIKSIRKKYACPPKDPWTVEQQEVLKVLAEDFRRSKTQVDWGGVMESLLISFLPQKYRSDLSLLRKYYHILKREENPKALKKKREGALKWRNDNKSRYLKNNGERRKKIGQITKEYLLNKLPRY